jgi:hypothetical protein
VFLDDAGKPASVELHYTGHWRRLEAGLLKQLQLLRESHLSQFVLANGTPLARLFQANYGRR